jgi:hypothetical protein
MVEYMNVRMPEIPQTRNLGSCAHVHNRKLSSRYFARCPGQDVIDPRPHSIEGSKSKSSLNKIVIISVTI